MHLSAATDAALPTVITGSSSPVNQSKWRDAETHGGIVVQGSFSIRPISKLCGPCRQVPGVEAITRARIHPCISCRSCKSWSVTRA
jgi:hypothetical protein